MAGLHLRGVVLAEHPDAGPVDLVVEQGRITSIEHVPGAEDAGLLLAPGFVDLQCNGGVGIDLVSEPARLWELAGDLPRTGVTSFLPTLVSCPDDVVEEVTGVLAAGPPAGWVGARPLGLHLEGPYLSRPGAHRPEELRRPVAGHDHVVLVTLAPELPGALELVEELSEVGIVVAIGHTGASAEQALAAVGAGARMVTHLFNAMTPMHHRDPGVVGVALADRRLAFGVIVDGVHVHPVAVAAAWRPGRTVLVTDATAARGARPGPFRLGGIEAVWDGTAVRTTDGTLAGSALAMDQAVRNLVEYTGCSAAEALAAATATPAAVIGRRAELVPGADADFVLLDADLRVAVTVVAGEVAHDRDRRFA